MANLCKHSICISQQDASLWKDGELVVAQGRKRLYWELAKISPSGVTGATGTGLTYSDTELDDIARRAVLAVDNKPDGLFGVDMAYDRNGIPNPTEINISRFFTTHKFFIAPIITENINDTRKKKLLRNSSSFVSFSSFKLFYSDRKSVV